MIVNDLVRKAGLSGNYGGITFASASFAPALDGIHFLYDETAGFSALMNMFDRNPAAKLEERTWAGQAVDDVGAHAGLADTRSGCWLSRRHSA